MPVHCVMVMCNVEWSCCNLEISQSTKYKLRKKSNTRPRERLLFLTEAAVLFAECVRPINAMESRDTIRQKKKDPQSVTMST